MPKSNHLNGRMHWARLLLCACALVAANAQAQGLRQGTVISIGGALDDDNDAVWHRVVSAAGGAGARFVVMAAASGNPDRSAAAAIAQLQRRGAVADHLRVAPGIDGIDLEAEARNETWLSLVRQADGVFFTGGDQSRIVQTLAPNERGTPLLQAIRDLLARGGVVAGTSAGAAVMSQRMFTGGEPLDVLKGTAGTVHGPGLGFLKGGVLIDQHFLKRGRIGRLLPLMAQLRVPLGLGVDEDSAVVVQGDQVEVIGARGALVAELPDPGAKADADASLTGHAALAATSTAPFSLHGARLSYLDAGDRYNLVTRTVSPAAQKARAVGPGNPAWQPYFEGEQLVTNILGDFSIVDAMARLVDSRSVQVQGLAFDPLAPAGAPLADLGFLWRLSRGPGTAAWSAGARYSISSVLLDITPVRMAQPLYTPWP